MERKMLDLHAIAIGAIVGMIVGMIASIPAGILVYAALVKRYGKPSPKLDFYTTYPLIWPEKFYYIEPEDEWVTWTGS